MRLILASASPRRAELLRAAGIDFDVMASNADETLISGESPDAYVRRVAETKARIVTQRASGRPVLAADTVVVVDDEIFGKPLDRGDAARMLRGLSGRTHEVVTAVVLADSNRRGSVELSRSFTTVVERTIVEFAAMSEAEIDWYVQTGEPDDKAGAYAIQGYAARFVIRIAGSYSNVVGLPVAVVYRMLHGR